MYPPQAAQSVVSSLLGSVYQTGPRVALSLLPIEPHDYQAEYLGLPSLNLLVSASCSCHLQVAHRLHRCPWDYNVSINKQVSIVILEVDGTCTL